MDVRSLTGVEDSVSEWLRRWTRNPLGSARAGSNPAAVAFVITKLLGSGKDRKNTHRGARTHDHQVKSLTLYRLS